MITRRTKIQLLIFVLITVVGVTFVGARYARLDRLVRDDTYTVVAHYKDSGGVFAGAQVTYRGVGIGSVDKLKLTDEGVDVYLDIEKGWDNIPADALAVVGNRSAVGEQFVDLQPQTSDADGPYLEEMSQIDYSKTSIPIQTPKLLADLATTVGSVNRDDLRTTVLELGDAFGGTGEDLENIIDTSTSFIDLANENFDVTAALIRDGNTVLRGQAASEGSIRNFSRQLRTFSNTLVDSDDDLRSIIDNGSATANQLRTFLEQNEVNLGSLIRNLVVTGKTVVKYLPGIRQLLSVYPYVVEGSYTVAAKSPDSGLYDAHFGLVLSTTTPCYAGYTPKSDQRSPSDGSNRPMNTNARCSEPITKSNPRGSQNIPRPGASYRTPVASYDPSTGALDWTPQGASGLTKGASVTQHVSREERWKWLYLQPLSGR